MDQNFIKRESFNDLYNSTTEIGRMISGLMSYLQNSGIKGTKYKNTKNS